MHEAFLADLAFVLVVAAATTVVFSWIRQPVVLGYILAGLIVGPHTPPFYLHDPHSVESLSELGVILMMFCLGLEFNLKKLFKVGWTALIAASAEIILMVWLGIEVGEAFGWKRMDCIFLGGMLAISSTTIILKAFQELGLGRAPFTRLVLGVLIVEDILGIVLIALLSGIAATGRMGAAEMLGTSARLIAFLVGMILVGFLFVPRFIGFVARFNSNEMLVVTSIGLCFGGAVLAVKAGYSVALGAFLTGALIAESREIERVEHLVQPIRDLFGAIFFVSIGMLIQPRLLVQYAWPIVAITLVVVAGKVVSCCFGTYLSGVNLRDSLAVGLSLAQIGEFSFIIAALGQSANVTSEFLYPLAVAVSVLTTLLTPYLIKGSGSTAAWIERRIPPNLVHGMATYTRWVGAFAESAVPGESARRFRSCIVEIILNLILVSGVFLLADYGARHPPGWMRGFPGGTAGLDTAFWFAAMLTSSPLLWMSHLRFRHLGALIADGLTAARSDQEKSAEPRRFLGRAFSTLSFLILGSSIIVMSTDILPSWEDALMIVIGVVAAGFAVRRSIAKVYSRAANVIERSVSDDN